MKLIENSSVYVAAGSALLVFSVIQIGTLLGRLVVWANTNDSDRNIFYALLAVSIFAVLSSLGVLLRRRAAYFGAVFACLVFLGFTILDVTTEVAASSHLRYGVLRSTTAPLVAKSVILLTTMALLGSKSVRQVFVATKGEQDEALKP